VSGNIVKKETTLLTSELIEKEQTNLSSISLNTTIGKLEAYGHFLWKIMVLW